MTPFLAGSQGETPASKREAGFRNPHRKSVRTGGPDPRRKWRSPADSGTDGEITAAIFPTTRINVGVSPFSRGLFSVDFPAISSENHPISPKKVQNGQHLAIFWYEIYPPPATGLPPANRLLPRPLQPRPGETVWAPARENSARTTCGFRFSFWRPAGRGSRFLFFSFQERRPFKKVLF